MAVRKKTDALVKAIVKDLKAGYTLRISCLRNGHSPHDPYVRGWTETHGLMMARLPGAVPVQPQVGSTPGETERGQ